MLQALGFSLVNSFAFPKKNCDVSHYVAMATLQPSVSWNPAICFSDSTQLLVYFLNYSAHLHSSYIFLDSVMLHTATHVWFVCIAHFSTYIFRPWLLACVISCIELLQNIFAFCLDYIQDILPILIDMADFALLSVFNGSFCSEQFLAGRDNGGSLRPTLA